MNALVACLVPVPATDIRSPDPSGEPATPCSLPPIEDGRVFLDGATLRRLRHERLLSQQDLADECWRRNIRVSIATIKRAEIGRAVRFRVARELARFFDISPATLLAR